MQPLIGREGGAHGRSVEVIDMLVRDEHRIRAGEGIRAAPALRNIHRAYVISRQIEFD